jgi:hypothetical protein
MRPSRGVGVAVPALKSEYSGVIDGSQLRALADKPNQRAGAAPGRSWRKLSPMDPSERDRRALIGAIETIATLVVVLAIVAFVVWFLFFAHDPLLRV